MLKLIKYYGLILAIFSATTTGITSTIYIITKKTINNVKLIQQQSLFNQIISSNLYDNNLVTECYIINNNKALGNLLPHRLYIAKKSEKPIAAVIESTAPNGYSGAIKLLVAADFNGKVLGVRVIEHHETPGLGDKIDVRISNWINNFTGKKVFLKHDAHWATKKDGGDFDQFTGATITPRAVIKAIENTVIFIQSILEQLTTLSPCLN